jgi:hypothetical protein
MAAKHRALLFLGRKVQSEILRSAVLRVCDFFECARKTGLKTKDLSASKRPTNQKSHKLSE